MTTLLIAETDPRAIDLLPRLVSDNIPNVEVDICTSTEDLTRNCKVGTYDTVAISPILLQGYRLLKHRANRHLLAPIIVTASREDRELASRYLEKDAFDLIVKPLDPEQAVQTVRMALWQNSLLKMLAAREQATSRFQEHMKNFPHARKMEEEFAMKMAAYEKTLLAITTSMQHLLNSEEERSLFDLAGFVESVTKKQALDRLLNLCQDGTSH